MSLTVGQLRQRLAGLSENMRVVISSEMGDFVVDLNERTRIIDVNELNEPTRIAGGTPVLKLTKE